MRKPIIAAASLGAATLLAVAVPLSASAHVRLGDDTATAGSYTLLTFRVPNESATATTDAVTFTLPEATPFASVSYVPTPGWTTELKSTKLTKPIKVGESSITDAVTSVVFTAAAGSDIKDGQLQLFSISVGPVPDVDSVAITAAQHYTDGSVVNWNDTSADAEEPAPVLYVNAAPPAGDESAVTATPTSGNTQDTLARIVGIGGLVIGVVGVVIAIATRRQQR